MQTKKCPECKKSKQLKDFYKDRSRKDGLQCRCKECGKKKTVEFKQLHPNYYKEQNKKRYNQLASDKTYNKKRYLKHRDNILKREDKWLRSARGRLSSIVTAAVSRGRKYNRKVTINLEWALKEYKKQQGKCAMTGIQFSFDRKQGNRVYNPFSPSIDRIDSNKGYIPDNCRIVCTIVNIALNRFGDEPFRIMCENYIKQQKSLSPRPVVGPGLMRETRNHGRQKNKNKMDPAKHQQNA